MSENPVLERVLFSEEQLAKRTAELGRQNRAQRRCERRLAMVNVTNRAHVYVGLLAFVFFLGHFMVL